MTDATADALRELRDALTAAGFELLSLASADDANLISAQRLAPVERALQILSSATYAAANETIRDALSETAATPENRAQRRRRLRRARTHANRRH